MRGKVVLRLCLGALLAAGSVWLGLAQGGAEAFAGKKAGEERQSGGVKLCWCPAGSFRMGSPPSEAGRSGDEGPVQVTLSRGFWMGKYEVTQGEWARIAGAFPNEGVRKRDKGEGPDYPVYWVSYFDAEEFCRRLTSRARASDELPANWEFRLPTEAQWEYACRAGTTTATSFGDGLSSREANISHKSYNAEPGDFRGEATPVGKFAANAWGLHDMHGNVWEWCRDWYHFTLPGGADPEQTMKGIPNRDGSYSKVRRSGAWIEEGRFNRSAARLRFEAERSSDHIGFRVVAVRL
jgi:formylglycine-generating enzyme required for sulfatase activity